MGVTAAIDPDTSVKSYDLYPKEGHLIPYPVI